MTINYDAMIAQAAEFVAQSIRIDMCRHETVTEPTFWLFSGDEQIGCAAFERGGAMPWRGTRMRRGIPYAQQNFIAMDGALRFAAERR